MMRERCPACRAPQAHYGPCRECLAAREAHLDAADDRAVSRVQFAGVTALMAVGIVAFLLRDGLISDPGWSTVWPLIVVGAVALVVGLFIGRGDL